MRAIFLSLFYHGCGALALAALVVILGGIDFNFFFYFFAVLKSTALPLITEGSYRVFILSGEYLHQQLLTDMFQLCLPVL